MPAHDKILPPDENAALDLMQRALALLDKAGQETLVTVHLQWAIDILTAAPAGSPDDDLF